MAMAVDAQAVLDHLVFHKSLIEDSEDTEDRGARLENYIRMVNEMGQGKLVPSDDPFERGVALVFELVVQQKFDPWDIDLVEFSKMYLSRVRKASELNLIVAGKLVYMAWEILRMQSEQVLRRVDRPETVELMFEGWDPDGLEMFVEPFELGSGEVLLHSEQVPIDEKVRRRADRPVTLIDLLDAFEEAKKESDIRQELARLMQKYRRPEFDDKAHKDSLEDDIVMIWERIQRCGGGAIPFADICNGDREDRVTAFVAILYLAKLGKISIWQKKLPYGEIFLEVKVPWDIAQLEDAVAVENVKVETPVIK